MRLFIGKILIWILFVVLVFSCKKNNDCPECFSPPSELKLKITNKTNSIDLINSGFYDNDSIAICYYDNDKKKYIEFSIIDDTINNKSIIISNDITWKSTEGFKNYFLYLNVYDTDTVLLDVQTITKNCCTYHPVIEFKINGNKVEIDPNDYVYNLKK